MVFPTPCDIQRPIRLCEATRRFAWDSLHCRYGDEAKRNDAVSLDGIDGFDRMNVYEEYNAAIRMIAETAPLRLCEDERICGAATLGKAISGYVPATLHGAPIFGGMSHLTLDFPSVLNYGAEAIEEKIEVRLADNITDIQRTVLLSMQSVMKSFRIYHARYLEATEKTNPAAHEALKQVPFGKPRGFFEAVQSLWFTFSFIRLCGNWPGIGRIDLMLGSFLENDLKNGVLTIDEAREILASMFVKGCEWICTEPIFASGDAQHYQNILLGGTDENGEDVTNEVSYLVLDIVEELAIGDYPIAVRMNAKTPERFLKRIAEVIRHGGGIVAVYNEETVLKAFANLGYSEKEARSFANDGCWEVQIPGKTRFTYLAFDALQLLQKDTLKLNTDTPADFSDYETLYAAFRENLKNKMQSVCAEWEKTYRDLDESQFGAVFSVVSVFVDGCIERAKDYLNGGAIYPVISPHIGGAPDVGNSLHAIKKLVFDEKRISFPELMKILLNNWEGNEELRSSVLSRIACYGNDDDEADSFTVRVINDFADIVNAIKSPYGTIFTGGVSTFGRQVDWLPERMAVPFGKRKGDILSGNGSPTPGTDIKGATAVIKSYCKPDLYKTGTGAALEIKLLPDTVRGENGIEAIVALLKGFCALHGFFMQPDVIDARALIEAQKNPEEYRTLSVRVSGWNARFVTLNSEWQRMIIERTGYRP